MDLSAIITRRNSQNEELEKNAVFIFAVIGAYSSTKTMFNVGEMMVFGIIGMALVLLDIPLTPMLLSFILGTMIEKHVRRACIYFKGDWPLFLTRPISAILLLIAVVVVLMPVIAGYQKATG